MSSRLRTQTSSRVSFFAFQDIITSVSGVLILVVLMLSTELDRPSDAKAQTADPEVEQRLRQTLMDQARVEQENRRLQQMLAAAETAPAPDRLKADIDDLRSQLAAEQRKYAALLAEREDLETTLEERNRALGLLALRRQVDQALDDVRVLAEAESSVRAAMAVAEQQVIEAQAQLFKVRGLEGQLWLIPDKAASTKEPILVTVSADGVVLDRFDHPERQASFARKDADRRFRDYAKHVNTLDEYFVFLVRPSGIPLFEDLLETAKDEGFEVGFDALEEDRTVHFSAPPKLDDLNPKDGPPDSSTTQPPSSDTNRTAATPPHPAPDEGDDGSSSSSVPVPEKKLGWWQRFLNWIGLN